MPNTIDGCGVNQFGRQCRNKLQTIAGSLAIAARIGAGHSHRRGNRACPRRRDLALEPLEPRQMLAAQPVITELMANNGGTLLDGDGNTPDWIELYNAGDQAVDLAGYRLSDSDGSGWTFPSTVLQPGQYLVVFASGQPRDDYVDAAGNLHTNFRLQSEGEHLALLAPDGTMVSELDADGAPYPAQIQDVSYGLVQTAMLVGAGTEGAYVVPLQDYPGWTGISFDAVSQGFFGGPAGVGLESRPNDRTNFTDEIQTPLPDRTHAVYARFPFDIGDPAAISTLQLRLKYDNGFVAYLNGVQVAADNAPDNPSWFSSARDGSRRDSEALQFVQFDLSDHVAQLVAGQNVLAIHGLNAPSDNSDLLLVPQLIANRPLDQSPVGYLPTPTPGQPNFVVDAVAGPRISDVTRDPGPLADNQNLLVTATVEPRNGPVTSVSLVYRVMYNDPVTAVMVDDGSGVDATAGDGVFSASIPHAAAGPGQMVRWYVTASDADGNAARAPHFMDQTGDRQSAEYFGTVVADPTVASHLPVLQWFLPPGNERSADRRTGTRTSLYYDGHFYDNVFARLRGGTSANLPKKSYKFEFDREQRFRFRADEEPVAEFDLNTTYTNKDYVRQALTFETYDAAGVPGSEAFPVRVDRNGQFFSVAIFVEQPGEDLLRREGLDPNGALYKMYNTFASGTGNVRKETRRNEDNSDLVDFARNINTLSGTELRNYVFDHVDIPSVLNYLAATVITQNNDQSAKNYYLYRDSDGTGQWQFLPWDLDLTFGLHFMTNDSIMDDQIWADKDGFRTFAGVTIWPSHPFVGDREHPGNRSWNRLIDALYEIPEFRSMYLRRLRSLMDELLQPPGTPTDQLKFEARLDQLAEQLGPDVALDGAAWASPWKWGEDLTMQQAMDRLKQEYLAVRRVHLYQTHNVDRQGDDVAGIPHAQVGNPTIVIDPDDLDVNPSSGNQDQEYLRLNNPNDVAVDVSGWQLRGGIEHTFRLGTVIPAGGSLYVTPDAAAFRRRTTGPTGGQGLLVQGGYAGHLSNFGETVELVAADGSLLGSITTPAMPSDVQRFLRVTELNYNPAGSDETEFIELQNVSHGVDATTLDLTGVAITEGPSQPLTFPPGRTLGPGQFVLAVKDPAAFQAAYSNVDPAIVVGPYAGRLSNAGEQIKVEDATGSTIADFVYQDQWYAVTDGRGSSLVVRNVADPYGEKATWGPSSATGGSPGTLDAVVPLPGDANGDGRFDPADLLVVLQAGKYQTGTPATWSEGDFDGDGLFDQLDIVTALRRGVYQPQARAALARRARGEDSSDRLAQAAELRSARTGNEIDAVDALFNQMGRLSP